MKWKVFVGMMALQALILVFWPLSQIFKFISPFASVIALVVGGAIKFSLEKTSARKKQIGEGLLWAGAIWLGILVLIVFRMFISEMAQVAD